MDQYISLLKLLDLGVHKQLQVRDVAISNHTKLEEAFGLGVIEYKKRMHLQHKPGVFDSVPWDMIIDQYFESKAIMPGLYHGLEVKLVPSQTIPERTLCTEIHIFHDTSTDAVRILCSAVKQVLRQTRLLEYASLELFGDADPRPANAQINLYGLTGHKWAHSIAKEIETLLPAERWGYKVDYLYGDDGDELNCCQVLSPSQFHIKRQNIFNIIWEVARELECFYLKDLKQKLPEINKLVEARLSSTNLVAPAA